MPLTIVDAGSVAVVLFQVLQHVVDLNQLVVMCTYRVFRVSLGIRKQTECHGLYDGVDLGFDVLFVQFFLNLFLVRLHVLVSKHFIYKSE